MIAGPDLDELERLAGPVQSGLRVIPGIESVAVYRSVGRDCLDFRIDPEKCKKWGVNVADVEAVVTSALGGKGLSSTIEGEKIFDLEVRWPKQLRDGETAILDIPLDIISKTDGPSGPANATPRIRLRDVVTPAGKNGELDPKADFTRTRTASIYRAQGKRVLPVQFSVRGRPLAEVQADAAKKLAPLLKEPYQIEWDN